MTSIARGLAEFIDEATEILDAFGADLHALRERREAEVDPQRLVALFRSAHSLKGLGGIFGQPRIAALAHQAEDLLDCLRLGRVSLTDHVFEALLSTRDVLQSLIAEASRGVTTEALGARAAQLGDRLASLAAVGRREEVGGEDPLVRLGLDDRVRALLTEYERHRLRENVQRGHVVWKVSVAFEVSDFEARLTDLSVRLQPLGEVVSTLPSSRLVGEAGIAFELLFASPRDEAELQAAVVGTGATLARSSGRLS